MYVSVPISQHNLYNVLSSGGTLKLERISPQVIVLKPPEKLVLETQASGGYQKIQWTRNGINMSRTRTDTFFVNLPNELVNFFEIFVRKPTMTRDLGVYRVNLQRSGGQILADEAVFYVTPYSKYGESCITVLLCQLSSFRQIPKVKKKQPIFVAITTLPISLFCGQFSPSLVLIYRGTCNASSFSTSLNVHSV